MNENTGDIPKPDWLRAEKERLSNVPTDLSVRKQPPTLAEVALSQLKDGALKAHLKNDQYFVPSSFNSARELGGDGLNRIIEKVKGPPEP
jgi:hypothetical protein